MEPPNKTMPGAREPAAPARGAEDLQEARERVRVILRRLEARYGAPEWRHRMDAMAELIACILSQHTSDVNSLRAYDRLVHRFESWDRVADADTRDVADAIRCGGLADSKAGRIQAVLRAIRAEHGAMTLDFLRRESDEAARAYLMSLPGVGPKTAAIVLCFALGRPVIPVDTHVFRVAWRLGLIEKRIGEAKAHDALQAIVPDELVYPFHVALIQHGRQICKAPTPRCAQCPLTDLCRYYLALGRAPAHHAEAAQPT
jgi:endonuclease-3